MRERVDRLTDPQRECLRLVHQGFESKEIARALGISHHAVDTRLARAVHTLDVRGRKEAARLLAADERSISDRIAYGPPYVDHAGPGHDERASDENTSGGAIGQADGDAALIARSHRRFGWPLPTEKRRRNDLSFIALLFWVVSGAMAFGLVALGLVAIALTAHSGLSDLFTVGR